MMQAITRGEIEIERAVLLAELDRLDQVLQSDMGAREIMRSVRRRLHLEAEIDRLNDRWWSIWEWEADQAARNDTEWR